MVSIKFPINSTFARFTTSYIRFIEVDDETFPIFIIFSVISMSVLIFSIVVVMLRCIKLLQKNKLKVGYHPYTSIDEESDSNFHSSKSTEAFILNSKSKNENESENKEKVKEKGN